MKTLKPKEVAERLDVTVQTLQVWDNNDRLKAHRTSTNRRYYLPAEIDIFEKEYFGE